MLMGIETGLPPKNLRIKEPWLDWHRTLQLQKTLQSLGLAVEKLPDPISQSIETKIGNPKDPP